MDSDDEIEAMQLAQMNEMHAPFGTAVGSGSGSAVGSVNVVGSGSGTGAHMPSAQDRLAELRQTAAWVKIYPVYFDAGKSRAGGRRYIYY